MMQKQRDHQPKKERQMTTVMQSGVGLDPPHARGDPKNYSLDATYEKTYKWS